MTVISCIGAQTGWGARAGGANGIDAIIADGVASTFARSPAEVSVVVAADGGDNSIEGD